MRLRPRQAWRWRRPISGVRRQLVRVRRRWRLRREPPASLILLYHRVLPALKRDPFGLIVSKPRFTEHLIYLSKHYDVAPVERIVDEILAGRRPSRRQVAIAFDDGYADNYLHAYPVLERIEIPATIFLATDYLDSGQSYWWDRLQWALFDPARTHVTVPPAIDRSYRLSDERTRLAALRQVWKYLVPLEDGAREALLRTLTPDDGPSEEDRPLTWPEATAMRAGGLITFGAHTGSHPRLAALGPAAADTEIVRSAERIAERLGERPVLFAYPYGTPDDFTERTQEIVRQVGFRAAFVAEPGVVNPDTSPWTIPRIPIGDWSTPRLEDELQKVWLEEAQVGG